MTVTAICFEQDHRYMPLVDGSLECTNCHCHVSAADFKKRMNAASWVDGMSPLNRCEICQTWHTPSNFDMNSRPRLLPTHYILFDGDYIDGENYEKFIDDLQIQAGYVIGEYVEICATLEEDGLIRILGAVEKRDDWVLDQKFTVPTNWEMDRVRKMFEGSVYLSTTCHHKNVTVYSRMSSMATLEEPAEYDVKIQCDVCSETLEDVPEGSHESEADWEDEGWEGDL